jgi:hypothetical protein
LSETEGRLVEADAELDHRDENVRNLKLIVQRLTSNNNDMLAILVTMLWIFSSSPRLTHQAAACIINLATCTINLL